MKNKIVHPLDISNNLLPNNWTTVRIEDICRVRSGTTPKNLNNSNASGNIPFFKVADMNNSGNEIFMNNAMLKFTLEEINKMKLNLFLDGTIIFPKRGGAISTNKKRLLIRKSSCDSNIMCITPISVNSKYIYYWFHTIDLATLSDGSNVPQINHSDINPLLISLPPLNEQKRIVSKLEELFTKLDAGIEALKKTKVLLNQYHQSVLKYAFGGKLTEKWRNDHKNEIEPVDNLLEKITKSETDKVRRDVPSNVDLSSDLTRLEIPNTWSLISVAELLKKGALIDLKDGNHGGNHPKASEFSFEGLPFITASQVNNFRIDYENAPKLKGKPLEKLKVGFSFPGDIIITHKGTVGRVAVCNQECVLSPQTTYYRINKKLINEHFLSYFFASTIFQAQLAKVKSQTTRDFVSILKQYSLFVLLSHPLEQQQIVKVIDQYFSIIENAEKMININLNYSNRMRRSILKQAFEGNLVSQDSNDESASVLLEKIKQEKSAIENNTNQKSKRNKISPSQTTEVGLDVT